MKSRLLDEPRPAKPASQQEARLGLDPWGYRAPGKEQETPILGAERRRVRSVHSAPVLRAFVDHSLDRVKDHGYFIETALEADRENWDPCRQVEVPLHHLSLPR